jgi:hypothetical protein
MIVAGLTALANNHLLAETAILLNRVSHINPSKKSAGKAQLATESLVCFSN